jgi:hypothetical protein
VHSYVCPLVGGRVVHMCGLVGGRACVVMGIAVKMMTPDVAVACLAIAFQYNALYCQGKVHRAYDARNPPAPPHMRRDLPFLVSRPEPFRALKGPMGATPKDKSHPHVSVSVYVSVRK